MGVIATIMESVHTDFDGGAVAHAFGAEHLESQESPPYVVWVQRPRVQHTPDILENGPRALDADTLAQPVIARAIEVEVHVWGTDFDNAEAITEGLLGAVYNCTSGSVDYLGEQWPKQVAFDRLQRGEPVIVRLRFRRPVNARTWETTTIQGPQTPATYEYVEEL